MSEGTPEMVGAVVSFTVTLKLVVVALPVLSVAMQVTSVVPIGKVLPEAGSQLTLLLTSPSTTSLAAGAVKLALAPEELVASWVISEGTPEMVGAVVSCTVTLKVFSVLLPVSSVAVQVTVVVPIPKELSEAGTQFTLTSPSTASVAVGES